jgi:ABC-type enterochelin transport system permease subunit
MVAHVLGLAFIVASKIVSSVLVETFSVPESGGLIVIGSLFISGAVFLRFRRKRALNSDNRK